MAYEPLNSPEKEIRLLKVQQRKDSELIHCTLFTVALERAPDFVAVSYVWGDPSDTKAIDVNGKEIKVTRNCWTLLYDYSSFEVSGVGATFWIDAICINQADLQEREQQVRLMHLIYTKGRCEVHLGSFPPQFGFENDRAAIQALEFLAGTRVSKGHEVQGGDHDDNAITPWETRSDQQEEEAPTRISMRLIYILLNRPWFSRMWIVQEIVLGSKSPNTILFGDGAFFRFDTLVSACAALTQLAIDLPTVEKKSLLGDIGRVFRLMQTTQLYHTDPSQLSMLRLFYIFRDQSASDPRDKIYSILGILERSNPENAALVPVDYSASVEEVYARAVRAAVIATKRLDIICACQSPTGFERSWTPDWRQPWHRADLNNTVSSLQNVEPLFQASASLECDVSFSDDLRILSARGIIQSKIVRTSIKWSSRSIQDGIQLETEYIRLTDRWPARKNEQLESLFFAMAGGACYTSDDSGYEDPLFFIPGRSTAWCEKAWQSDAVTAEFIRMGEGRRLIRTSNESLGAAPEEAEVGDIVCVLFGCSVPVVLREVDDHYVFVGECYVHEIMQGELIQAVEMGELTSQVFDIK